MSLENVEVIVSLLITHLEQLLRCAPVPDPVEDTAVTEVPVQDSVQAPTEGPQVWVWLAILTAKDHLSTQ